MVKNTIWVKKNGRLVETKKYSTKCSLVPKYRIFRKKKNTKNSLEESFKKFCRKRLNK